MPKTLTTRLDDETYPTQRMALPKQDRRATRPNVVNGEAQGANVCPVIKGRDFPRADSDEPYG